MLLSKIQAKLPRLFLLICDYTLSVEVGAHWGISVGPWFVSINRDGDPHWMLCAQEATRKAPLSDFDWEWCSKPACGVCGMHHFPETKTCAEGPMPIDRAPFHGARAANDHRMAS